MFIKNQDLKAETEAVKNNAYEGDLDNPDGEEKERLTEPIGTIASSPSV